MTNIVIIGSGPSALFAAKTILESNKYISIIMLEQGAPMYDRFCSAENGKCRRCSVCSVLQGGGGAGLFSDGKLIVDLTSGGIAQGVKKLTDSEKNEIEDTILKTLKSFDGKSKFKEMPSTDIMKKNRELFEAENLSIKFYNVLHMGSNNLPNITQNFINYLSNQFPDRFCIFYHSGVTEISKMDFGYIVYVKELEYYADCVIVATGKSQAAWLKATVSKLGVKYSSHPFYFGLRMETFYSNIERLIQLSFDPKISRVIDGRKIKIHCMCRRGQVRYYRYKSYLNVGGHSPCNENDAYLSDSNPNANFNILLSYDESIISPERILSLFGEKCPDSIAVQRLGDFISSQTTLRWGKLVPSNENIVSPVNIRKIIDSFDVNFSHYLIDFLISLSKICPGIIDEDNILYAPTIEWDMDSVSVNSNMETDSYNLFAIGDGAGLSQGIVFSAATGILAAREISKRFAQGEYDE